LEKELMVQILKFCCVGASSTIIDKSVFFLLINQFGARWWTLYTCIAFCFGVTNGFYWNRRWTFNIDGKADGGKQYVKFVVTNVIGLALNLLITKFFLIMMLGHADAPSDADKTKVLIASLCAVPIVVIWNFSAARFWTFKQPKDNASDESSSSIASTTSR
jgi:putative flippase GtrA